MIVRIDKERQKMIRRQLTGDTVYAICHDALRNLQREGRTELAPVELFLSAREFYETIIALPDIEEGIDDEMDDLEDEAEGDNDAMLVMMLSTALMQAMMKRHVGIDFKKIILRIYERWNDHELFFPLLEQFANKEEARWLDGKKTNLLDYELQEIKQDGGGSEEVKQLFENFVTYYDKMDAETIKGQLLILNRYNIDHHHAYDKEIIAIYDKLGIRSTMTKEYNAVKHVENEFQNIAAGGVGVTKEYHKD